MTAIHIMTGASSGLGLASAKRLAERSDARIIVGARNPAMALDLKRAVPKARLEVLHLDTASPDTVRSFAQEVKRSLGGQEIASLACIAGLQILGPQTMTSDGFDQTFATNVLGHLLLVDELRECLAPDAVIVTIGSGTHDPANKLAARAGFIGADFTSAHAAAIGQSTRPNRDERGLALDRYATSKLCAIYHAMALTKDPEFSNARVYCFDPGLMPGTGLARQQNAAVRFVWKHILPAFASFLDGASTKERSARCLVDNLLFGQGKYPSGAHIEYSGKPAPASAVAQDLSAALRFLTEARDLV